MRNNKTYIQPNFYHFFEELTVNNNRDWFKLQKYYYESAVLTPFKALTEEVISQMQEIDSYIKIDFKQAAFRLYRDIRFSEDKSPYKLWMGAVVSREGRKNTMMPEIYFQFGPEANFIAAGLYRPDRQTLYKIRNAIALNPDQFRKIKSDKKLNSFFPNGIQGLRNKRLPNKNWQVMAQNCPLLLNKQYYAVNYYSSDEIVNKLNLPQFIVSHYKAFKSFNDWLTSVMQV